MSDPRRLRDYGDVDCDVAREALSARLDSEREPVPSARVDEHLASCPQCLAWYADTRTQTLRLRRMSGRSGVNLATTMSSVGLPGRASRWMKWVRLHWARAALALVGVIQTALAIAQIVGVDFGMVATHHGTMTGAHLLNESTAWYFAVGAGMGIAAAWPRTAAGLTCVLAVFTVVLSCYVVTDAFSGQVTGVRLVSHLPVVVATVLAFLVWRRGGPDGTSSRTSKDSKDSKDKGDIVLPDNATRGRRRGHLWPTDNSAA